MVKMNRSSWIIVALLAACVLGLAMAGGTWKVTSAQATTPTIPYITSLEPKCVFKWADKATLRISGTTYITGYPEIYTKVRLTKVSDPTFSKVYTPTLLQPNYLELVIPSEIMTASPDLSATIWDAVIENSHFLNDPPVEVGNHVFFMIADSSHGVGCPYFMPLMLNQ